MVSSRGKSKGCFTTFVERKTRFYIAVRMKDRTSTSMLEATCSVLAQLPQEAVKSVTSDRGKEFSCYKDTEAMGIPFYFAESYSSWQRGSNENCNGLLREFFPKKTDLAKVTKEELLKALLLINGRLRKCLGFKTTAAKAFLHELQILT